jgi:hypothetical protein
MPGRGCGGGGCGPVGDFDNVTVTHALPFHSINTPAFLSLDMSNVLYTGICKEEVWRINYTTTLIDGRFCVENGYFGRLSSVNWLGCPGGGNITAQWHSTA